MLLQQINRRRWFGYSALAAASLRAQSGPHIQFPTGAKERLSVSSYPFRSLMEKIGGLGQFAATIPEKLHVNRIEPWSHHFLSTEPAYLESLRTQFDSANVKVVNIPVDIAARLCGSSAERAAALDSYDKWINAAVTLRSPSIRVHLPKGDKPGTNTCAVSSLGELAQRGAAKNVVINLENDEPASEAPERIAQVVKAVGSPYLRALPDFCNSMLIHNDERYNDGAMAQLFPLAYNISHVKDEEHDGAKVFRVNMANIFAIAKRAGYEGYFSMEWEGEGDPYAGTAKLLEASLRYLS